MPTRIRLLLLAFALYGFSSLPQAAVATAETIKAPVATETDILNTSLQALIGTTSERKAAIEALVARNKLDIVPTLVLWLNVSGDHVDIAEALEKLTGERLPTWREAMLWQEAHPEVVPHPSYKELKLRYFASIDKNFVQFFDPKFTTNDKMEIRFEEIAWGGVKIDGIPSLDNPRLIKASEASYLLNTDLVFGVEINGDARAYPLRIMGWHEMFNEVIGGVPVALAYCTLCGSGILFETKLPDREEQLIFGSSGFLYRSNKLMFDRSTNSLWNQFTGEPVLGPLVDKAIKLKIRPVAITSWERWKRQHPETKVLSLETGFHRDYDSGVVYRDYFSSPDLMFPTIVRDESVLKRKDYVFGIRQTAASKAWPLKAFISEPVINDKLGGENLVLIGNPGTRTVRAYRRGNQSFSRANHPDKLVSSGETWAIGENYLLGPDGQKLPRLPGHISYWFAWDGYLGVKSALYKPKS